MVENPRHPLLWLAGRSCHLGPVVAVEPSRLPRMMSHEGEPLHPRSERCPVADGPAHRRFVTHVTAQRTAGSGTSARATPRSAFPSRVTAVRDDVPTGKLPQQALHRPENAARAAQAVSND